MLRVLKLAVFLTVVSFPSLASGQTPEPLPASQVATPGADDQWPTTPEKTSSWYGAQTLLSDAGAVSLLAVGSAFSTSRGTLAPALGISGAATYLLGAPTIHLLHGDPAKALASAGLRLGAPALGGLLGYGVGELVCERSDSDTPCPAVFGAFGLVLGFAAAVTIDAAALARESSVADTSPLAVTLKPSFQYERGAWRGVLSGTF